MRPPSPIERLESMISGLKASGMTPSEIARETKVSRQTLWRITVGAGSAPGYATFKRIEAVYAKRCGCCEHVESPK
jgi:DNA invertase Pin-like site-specific DNA recombinase